MSNERPDVPDPQPEEEAPEAEAPGAILVPHGRPLSLADRMHVAAVKSGGAMTSIPPAPDPDAEKKTPPYVHCVDDKTRPV